MFSRQRRIAVLALLAVTAIAAPALGGKVTICHVPPGKAVLNEAGEVDYGASKIVRIRTGKSATNGHEVGDALGEHKTHKHDFVVYDDADCTHPSELEELPPD